MTINCPACKAPLIKELEAEAESPTFRLKQTMRCPHCKKDAIIRIEARVVTDVFVNGKKIESRNGEPNIRPL